jgi:MFS family permease
MSNKTTPNAAPPQSLGFPQRYIIALQYRDFMWIWLGSLGGQSAYWALIVARGVLVLEMTGSSALVGITTFAAMVPRVVMPPIAGYMADRFDRRSILAMSYGLQFVHAAVLTALAFSGVLEVWHVIVLATFNGSVRTFQMAATQSLIPNIVPREHWLNALSLNQVTTHGSRLFGPGLVAPALLLSGPSMAFLFASFFYLLGIVGILAIKTRSTGGLKKGDSIGASVMEAARYAWGHPQIRVLFIIVALHCSMTMAFESLLPVYARDVLGNGRAGVSYLMMAVGTGALIAVIIIAGIRGAMARGRLLAIAGVFSGASMLALALSTSPVFAILAAAGMGAAQAGFMAISGAMVQALAPDEMRGRISGLNQINVGGTMAMVNLANGFAADAWGAPFLLTTLGVGFMVVMAASLLLSTTRGFYRGDIPLPVRAR